MPHRILINSLLVMALLLFILQTLAPNELAEAKKIKLKDLKKVKKYAILLAAQRHKFYAIPFPLPLPVFVKRQHIYTQVPVVPRYVQKPPASYGSSYGSAYATSGAAGSGYAAASEDAYSAAAAYAPALESSASSAGSGGVLFRPTGAAGRLRGSKAASKYGPLMQAASGSPTALVSVAGNGPTAASVQGELIGKILSGQAKVLPLGQVRVGSLLSSIKYTQQNRQLQQQLGEKQASLANQIAQEALQEAHSGSEVAASLAKAPTSGSAEDLVGLAQAPPPMVASARLPLAAHPHYAAVAAAAANQMRHRHPSPAELLQLYNPPLIEEASQQALQLASPPVPSSALLDKEAAAAAAAAAKTEAIQKPSLAAELQLAAAAKRQQQIIEALDQARLHQHQQQQLLALKTALLRAQREKEAQQVEARLMNLMAASQMGIPVVPMVPMVARI